MGKVTIEDISRQTGLSRGTVSRALNDRPDISERTKLRVLEACQKLNYVPSYAARSLATGRSFAIAVLLSNLESSFSATFLRGVIERAEQARYMVSVLELGPDARIAVDRLAGFSAERIDGVLVGAPLGPAVADSLAKSLAAQPVAACWPLNGLPCDVLTPDYAESGRLAARHLLKGSGDRVLYVHRAGAPGADERLAGFQQVCHEKGIDGAAATLSLPASADTAGLDGLLAAHLARADAVAASDDALAIDVMMAALRAGRRPGVNIRIMGQGNDRMSGRIHPSLTTVDYSGMEIGRRALDVVLQRLAKSRMDAVQVTHVTPTLIERESSQRAH